MLNFVLQLESLLERSLVRNIRAVVAQGVGLPNEVIL